MLADTMKHQTADYELIVIDDCEQRDLVAVKEYLAGHGIHPSYLGPSKPKCFPELAYNFLNTLNTGILASKGDILIFMQDYTWLPPDALNRFLARRAQLKEGYFISAVARYWTQSPPMSTLDLTHPISISDRPWEGPPLQNGWNSPNWWIPEVFELFYFAVAYDWLVKMNGFQECYDIAPTVRILDVMESIQNAGGKLLVDRDNICEMVDHRRWEPAYLWNSNVRFLPGETRLTVRPNCFGLSKHKRGIVA